MWERNGVCKRVMLCSPTACGVCCDRFGNEIAGVEELGTTGRGGDMQVCCCYDNWCLCTTY